MSFGSFTTSKANIFLQNTLLLYHPKSYLKLSNNVRIIKRDLSNKNQIKVRLIKPVINLGQPGDEVSVARGYMREVLFPEGLARYILFSNVPKRILKEKMKGTPTESDKITTGTMKLLPLPGVKPEDCSPERIHRIQVNIAILTHLPMLHFVRDVSHTVWSNFGNSSEINPPVKMRHVVQKLAQYGAELEEENMYFPNYIKNEIRTFGEHQCRIVFPEVRQNMWLKVIVEKK
ncbi:2081_t:CDS:2 [Ambispora leptoticha]|uniref:2081_t:CDS:1 n=1 Tax=Ambispora leptoticha TaxID=144679 RepID=A0A9N8VN44_9GLOM|nr:2081_t:CDS:2 [Ambispora leptoticha]